MSKRIAHDEVTTDVNASPEQVYALVADIQRMGQWSPETVKCSWAKGATGPAVGTEHGLTPAARHRAGHVARADESDLHRRTAYL